MPTGRGDPSKYDCPPENADEPSHARERRWLANFEINVNSRRPVMRDVLPINPAILRRKLYVRNVSIPPMFGRKKTSIRVQIWADAPELSVPDNPALFTDTDHLWLAYETTAEPRGEVYAVVRFEGLLEHRLLPINDEGLGEHEYAAAGLRWYSFNEVLGSPATERWSALQARYWVITFKDVTVDVVAKSAAVVYPTIRERGPVSTLMSVVCGERNRAT